MLVALLLLSLGCLVAVDVLWLILAVPWVGLLDCGYPDHPFFMQLCSKVSRLYISCYLGLNVYIQLCSHQEIECNY